MSANGGFPFVEIAAWWLIILGSAAEGAAIYSAVQAQRVAKVWRRVLFDDSLRAKWKEISASSGDVSDVLKALIAKLPWMAIMGLTTIILGMVLLMGRWPWHPPG